MNLAEIIKEPIETEKTALLREKEHKKYAFVVAYHANKFQIQQAIWAIFGVKVKKINLLIRKPKKVKTGTKNPGFLKRKKIAYVTLNPGAELNWEEKTEKEEKPKEQKIKKGVLKKINK